MAFKEAYMEIYRETLLQTHRNKGPHKCEAWENEP